MMLSIRTNMSRAFGVLRLRLWRKMNSSSARSAVPWYDGRRWTKSPERVYTIILYVSINNRYKWWTSCATYFIVDVAFGLRFTTDSVRRIPKYNLTVWLSRVLVLLYCKYFIPVFPHLFYRHESTEENLIDRWPPGPTRFKKKKKN